MIVFDGVTYRYPGRDEPTLREFAWTLERGEYVLLAGPSGSGKSTIARCLTGLIPHFHGGRFGGRVLVFGDDTRGVRPAQISRRVGFIAQEPESQTVMDRVEDEIAFGPENHGLARRDIRWRVEEALDLLGLAALRDREIASLSGGERQRVVIAAAMAMRPELLVLDEPTSQLDPWGAEEVLGVLAHLNADLGTTMVLIEHRLERVLGLVERLVVLSPSGAIAADGTPAAAASALDTAPPLLRAGRTLGWHPLPLTVRDARRAASVTTGLPDPPTNAPAAGPVGDAVELERVSFQYDGWPVLHDISVRFPAGAVTAVMGRNGSGKTTLLKHINGLLRPASGRVRVLGQDIARRGTTDLARFVAYLPQNPSAMLFNGTVDAELQFTLRCLGRPGDVDGTLDRFGLREMARRNPMDLSVGERQRVALAAILVARPSVTLLDEPTRGMDTRRKEGLAAILRELAESGSAVVVATHDVDLAARCADRVVLLGDGQVVAEGPPRRVLCGSLAYSTSINRVFGSTFLVPEDVVRSSDDAVEPQTGAARHSPAHTG